MSRAEEYLADKSRHVWDGDSGTFTEYAPDGTIVASRPLTAEEANDVPPGRPSPSIQLPDLPTLADQVTQLNDAVQLLILTTLGT